MDGWLVAALGLAVPAGISYLFYKDKRNYCKVLQDVKLYPIDEDLKELAKSEGIPYGAVSGYVKANEDPIISAQDVNKTPGVIHRIIFSEHKSEWSQSNKSWKDVKSTLNSSTSSVAFSLDAKGGEENRIAVSEPLIAEQLTYNTIYNQYVPVQSSLSDNIISFASGTKIKGHETKEEMLIEGTKLTGIGKIQFFGGELRLSPPGNTLKYILSTSSLSSIVDSETSFARLLRGLSIFFAISGGLCLTVWLYRKLKKWYDARQQEIEFQRLSSEYETISDNGRECVVCLHEQRNVVLLNCGHICVCKSCSEKLSECPICRSRIEKIVPTFHST